MRGFNRCVRIGRAALATVAVVACSSAASGQAPAAGAMRQARAARQVPLQRAADAARATTNGFRQPEDWGFAGLHVLNVKKAVVTIPGAGAGGAPQDFEVLTYNGRPHGPTIRVRRGSTFSIRVRNHLHDDPGPDNPDRPDRLCTTNLHTHGLHVSPADPGDNVYLCIEPGKSHTFTYRVPDKHPSGTYWYHPHKHGSVGYQVSNGLAGALIVEGSADDGIADLEEVPEIAAARDRIFLFQQYDALVGTDGVARIDAATIYNPATTDPGYPRTCDSIDLHAPPGYDPGDPAPPIITINGVVMPEVHLAPGEVQRWRFVHAGIEQEQLMIWTDAQGNPIGGDGPDPDPTKIQFLEIAKDGLATGDLKVNPQVGLYPGYRLDVLVRAPALPPGDEEAVYLIKKVAADGARALRAAPKAAAGAPASDDAYLLKVVVRGRPRAMNLPTRAALAPCRAMAPVGDGELSPPTPPFDQPVTFSSDDDKLAYLIQGRPFHKQTPARIPLGTAQEWQLQATLNSHPFHIHVNPFQVTKHLGPPPDRKPLPDDVGDWKDTLFLVQDHTYTIRSRFKDFDGQAVFHCHILDHEDQGMMMPLEFHDGNKPLPQQAICHAVAPGVGAGPGAPAKLTPASSRAPALRLPEAGGAVRDLASLRGGPVVLVFFQGAACGHCAGQLRELIREARGSDAPVVAVSAAPVADRAATLAALGVVASDRFHLLVDADHRSFRDFGCFDEAPLHGLFLIDRDGVIRASYRGEAPFGDVGEAVRRARSLSPTPERAALR